MKRPKRIISLILTFAAVVTPFNYSAHAVSENTSTLSKETTSFYDYWKEKYLAENTYVSGENNTMYSTVNRHMPKQDMKYLSLFPKRTAMVF